MRKQVVVIGAGFGGLAAARGLATANVDVTVMDRRNHHLFQPLLYQVATGGLSPADIAQPIRRLLRGQHNCQVLLAEAHRIDAEQQVVQSTVGALPYDWCVVAAGSTHSYFGNDHWAEVAPGLKSIEDALEIRSRVLLAFERAELEPDPDKRAPLLTFVVIGGGPTGVELAGAIREIALRDLRGDFRWFDPSHAQVILLESGDNVLPRFPPNLQASARRQLERLGVEVRTGCVVTDVSRDTVTTTAGTIAAATTIWAAGVGASPLGRTLESPTDRGGRVMVEPDLSLPAHPSVFVIGDLAAAISNGQPVPGVAPAAMQGGAHAAAAIRADLEHRSRPPFIYRDRGSLATIGRSSAVASLSPRLRLSGHLAWCLWWAVHIVSLVDFRSKVYVMLGWMWQYISFGREARLITSLKPPHSECALRRLSHRDATGGRPTQRRGGPNAV